jgi:hypothetical protein
MVQAVQRLFGAREMNNEPVAWISQDVLDADHIIKAVVRREQDEQHTIPLYTHSAKELTDEDYKEALACLQFALNDTMDYLTLNNLGGENNHWLVWARAILRKAQEK